MKNRIFLQWLVATMLIIPLDAALASDKKGYRASILHFTEEQGVPGFKNHYIHDGLLIIEDGVVESVGAYTKKQASLLKEKNIVDYRGQLILPGFIDTHIHYPQTEMIAAYGEQLLEWLNQYTFPTEKKYGDYKYAKKQADFFINQLIRNGTTTALVFGTVHPESVDAIFAASEKLNMRMIAGKVMMDRNAPEYLLDTPESSYKETQALIKKWHGKKRLQYAITPRFAPTSTPAQLMVAGKLKAENPDVYMHTHLSENKGEIAWVKSLFPDRSGYLDVYDHYGLTGSKSIFAHGVHLTDAEFDKLAETDSIIAFCPTSNLFLGSGLFPLAKAEQKGIRVGMGTDVGAGTSFSMLETLSEAYKIQQLQGQKLSAFHALYLATLGGAKALSIDDKVGNFESGKEADFVVLNFDATPLQKLRLEKSKTVEEKLFYLMMLGDDRNVSATYVAGEQVFEK